MFKELIGEARHQELKKMSDAIIKNGALPATYESFKRSLSDTERTVSWLMVSGIRERNVESNFKNFRKVNRVRTYLKDNNLKEFLIRTPFTPDDKCTLALPRNIQMDFDRAAKQLSSSVFIDSKGRKRLIVMNRDLGLANSFIVENRGERLLATGHMFSFYIG